MKVIKRLGVLILIMAFSLVDLYGQIDSTSLRIPQLTALQNNQNLVSKAIEGAVYMVRQEYLLESPSGEQIGRGILKYFGKMYRVGILANSHLWIPTSIIKPWKDDPNFIEHKENYRPVCSHTKIKRINIDKEYRGFMLEKMDSSYSITSFNPGLTGLQISDTLPLSGNLILYYLDADESPDDSTIKSTSIRLKQIQWDEKGIAEVDDIIYKDRIVLGGVMFLEKISLGRIDIELIAIYTDIDKNWVLQAVHPIKQVTN